MYKKYKKRKSIKIAKFKERAILGDILPYEIPLLFSNDNFYNYLIKRKDIDGEPDIIKDILDIWDKDYTIPLNFKISHKENSFRKLSIIHPGIQIKIIDFYDKYKNLIIYYSNISKFSIRKPIKISHIEFYNDTIHKNYFKENKKWDFEQYNEEYKSYSNFFVYKKYNNLYRFFEDYEFHKSEKKFSKMLSLDISKCFDSIYTHSISWAIIDKDYVKQNKEIFSSGFWSEFDNLMQKMNYNETNGIIIWPEFSRLFAEIILQRIDKNVLCILSKNKKNIKNKIDYSIYRYVDDYFIFYNDDKIWNTIERVLKIELEKFHLFISDEKRQEYRRPIITNITIAKLKLKKLFYDLYNFLEEENSKKVKFTSYLDSKYYITSIKSIIKENQIQYSDVLNYIFTIIEKTLKRVIKKYWDIWKDNHNRKNVNNFLSFIIHILDIVFFIYSVNPKVSYTIKISYILNHILDIFRDKNYKIKKWIFIELDKWQIDIIKKKVYDEICLVLKNNKNEDYKEIETIYLLNNLETLWRNYLLNEEQLERYIWNLDNLNYFSLVNIINYIWGNKLQYKNIYKRLLRNILDKFKSFDRKIVHKNSELVFLLFDLLVCPYLEEDFKMKILFHFYGEEDRKKRKIIINYLSENELFFFKWGNNSNFSKEILKKKKIEVY